MNEKTRSKENGSASARSCFSSPSICSLVPSSNVTADCAISLACRVRCFGLPLYNAIAREALAARLGLLPFLVSAIGTKRTYARALQMSAFGGKADMPFCTANVR